MSTAPIFSVRSLSVLWIKSNANPSPIPFPLTSESLAHPSFIIQEMNRSVDIRTAKIVHVEWYDGFVRLLILLLTTDPQPKQGKKLRAQTHLVVSNGELKF
jgi:hypothetical protein